MAKWTVKYDAPIMTPCIREFDTEEEAREFFNLLKKDRQVQNLRII